MDNITLLKLSAATLIFIMGLSAGLLSRRTPSTSKHSDKLSAFANGIFLGAALFHLLPDADQVLRQRPLFQKYPLALLICALAFVAFFSFEAWLSRRADISKSKGQDLHSGLILTFLLSAHAFGAGASLGSHMELGGILILLTAILAHKGLASAALALHLKKLNISNTFQRSLIAVFSCMTPLGILSTFTVGLLLDNMTMMWVSATLNALTAGTFLYMGTLHWRINIRLKAEPTRHTLIEIGVGLCGLLAMASLAIWV